MKQLSNIFNVVDEAVGVTVCEYLGIGDGPGMRNIHRFAIDWDEDHDERIVTVIEEWINTGWMDHVLIMGERKAFLSIVTDDYGKEDPDEVGCYMLRNWLADRVGRSDLAYAPMPDFVGCQMHGGEDVWNVLHVRANTPWQDVHGVNTQERYRSLISLFGLGSRGLFVPARRG